MIGTVEFFRVIAFFAIFIHHLGYAGGLGSAGVSAFILIAGFVSAINLAKFETINRKTISQYYLSRAIRLFPVHILTFVLSLPLVHYTQFKSTFFYAIINILLLQSWFPNGIQIFSFNSVSWFISDIVFFSLLTPFILFYMKKSKLDASIIKLFLIGCALWGIAVLITLYFKGMLNPYSFSWWFIYASPYFRLFDYLLGLVAGVIYKNLKEKDFNGSMRRKWGFSLLEVMSLICFIILYKVPYFKYDALVMSVYYTPSFIFIIMAFSFQQGVISSMINNIFSVYVGRLTYSAYMIHQLIISYIIILFLPTIQGPSGDFRHFFAQIIVFLFAMCAADVIYRHYEIPSTKFLTQHLQIK